MSEIVRSTEWQIEYVDDHGDLVIVPAESTVRAIALAIGISGSRDQDVALRITTICTVDGHGSGRSGGWIYSPEGLEDEPIPAVEFSI